MQYLIPMHLVNTPFRKNTSKLPLLICRLSSHCSIWNENACTTLIHTFFCHQLLYFHFRHILKLVSLFLRTQSINWTKDSMMSIFAFDKLLYSISGLSEKHKSRESFFLSWKLEMFEFKFFLAVDFKCHTILLKRFAYQCNIKSKHSINHTFYQ